MVSTHSARNAPQKVSLVPTHTNRIKPNTHLEFVPASSFTDSIVSIQTLSTSLKGLTKTVEIPRSQLLLRLHGREADANQSEEAEIEEDCPKCKHPRMSFYTAQLRGVDEGQTIFYTCLNERCGHKFTVNS